MFGILFIVVLLNFLTKIGTCKAVVDTTGLLASVLETRGEAKVFMYVLMLLGRVWYKELVGLV